MRGQATTCGLARGAAEVVVETEHPVARDQDVLEIAVPGASALYVTFNGTTNTDGHKDTRVEFYQDKELTRLVAARRGPAFNFKPFMAPCPRLYVKTVHTPTEGVAWRGWSCTARGLQGVQWMNELDVQLSSSVEWSTWLLDFVATKALPSVLLRSGVLHTKELVDALCSYLQAPRVPFRQEVLGSLL